MLNSSQSPGCPADSILLDPAEFTRLNHAYGPVTFDACVSAFYNVFPNYCLPKILSYMLLPHATRFLLTHVLRLCAANPTTL
jgi:hypothetical protein